MLSQIDKTSTLQISCCCLLMENCLSNKFLIMLLRKNWETNNIQIILGDFLLFLLPVHSKLHPNNISIEKLFILCTIFAKEMPFWNSLIANAFRVECGRTTLTTNQCASNGANKTPIHVDMGVVCLVFLTQEVLCTHHEMRTNRNTTCNKTTREVICHWAAYATNHSSPWHWRLVCYTSAAKVEWAKKAITIELRSLK